MKRVLILGASPESDRYSNLAMKNLLSKGHEVVLVSPKYDEIDGYKCYRSLSEVKEKVDAITMYVSPKISTGMKEDILKISPKVVIFNPGTENPEIENALNKDKIKNLEACTLVLLNTGQFEGIF